MGRIFRSTTAASIRNQIHGAVFGHSGAAVSYSVVGMEDIRALSQEFALAVPGGGGGAMLAIHSLGHQTRQSRMGLRD